MKILHIDSSILGEHSVSRQLSAKIVEAEVAAHLDAELTYLDLAVSPIAHLSGGVLAKRLGAEGHDPDAERELAIGDAALSDFLAADVIVIGVPMYNFSVPSQLKAWIDHMLVAGKTFRYTDVGAEGLAGGKRVIVAISRGGFYGAETPMAAFEHQESYLRGVFAFIGITDILFVRAEGIAMGPEQRDAAIAQAVAVIGAI